jgi:hypothetical protein
VLAEEHSKTHEIHTQARSDMLVKYFAEKVNPGLHDVAAKKEAFGAWNEEYIHNYYAILKSAIQEGHSELEERMRQEHAALQELTRREHAVHKAKRGDLLVKYFAEKVDPSVHDLAAKKEGFGAWNEEFIHTCHQKVAKALHNDREEAVKTHEVHIKARKDMIVK